MNFSDHVENLKGVGPSTASKLNILGVKTVGDLITFYPRRFEDYSEVSKIKDIKPGNNVTIKGFVKQVNGRYVRRGMHITECLVSDETGSMRLVWFNQPYRAGALKPNQAYYVSGSFEMSRGRLSIMNPAMELESTFPINTARIVPVYRETKGLKSSAIRKAIASVAGVIEKVPEILPEAILLANNLVPRAEAVMTMHFPSSSKHLNAAKERLGFEELFTITLASLVNKQQFMRDSGVSIKFNESLAKQFSANLPYYLTNAQRKVVWQIYKDMASTTPMNRLVEGDVGSGKTVVAAMAAVMVMDNNYQAVFMAPTELLAFQHYETIKNLLKKTEFAGSVGLLTGSMKPAEKRRIHSEMKAGNIKFIVGTHALIADSVDMHKLGLVIIDEQHRFGVQQRKKLQAKAGHMPHVLSMTATPIPRSLALTIYGELDISVLDEMPPGRMPTITKIVSPNSRSRLYQDIELELKAGRQMFVVCPLIEESDKMTALSAEAVYENLSKKVFKQYKVGLLHGKMKPAEKDAIMETFVSAELNILVSTTVIEVGVDVPNATVMLVEGVERFGLAQLHQLRGRIGRGNHQGYCYLVMSDSKEPTRRLRALEQVNDGFKLAELDLEIRGPGAIYGTVQSGQLDLKIANLSDVHLISRARKSAADFIESKENLKNYPLLSKRVQKYRSITNLN